MPRAGCPPMVAYCIPSSFIQTLLIAPLTPPIPYRMLAPSNAGPAAVEQAIISSRFPRAISPLVPISIKRASSSFSAMPDAIMAATVSAPTYPATIGSRVIRPAGHMSIPSFNGSRSIRLAVTGIKGETAMFLTGSPANRCIMMVFPANVM